MNSRQRVPEKRWMSYRRRNSGSLPSPAGGLKHSLYRRRAVDALFSGDGERVADFASGYPSRHCGPA